MKITYDPTFTKKLERQIEYIKGDKHQAARKFKKDIISKIKEIPSYPKSYRKSIFFEDENIRDLIFKGYVVLFKIAKNQIVVFGFVKWEEGL
jgi:plasmid stabilization system protein ParE